MYRFSDNGLNRPVADDVRKLRKLADDLERLSQGIVPTQAELAASPEVDIYWLDTRPVVCLRGDLFGHPRLSAPHVTTTQVWAFAPELGWARTHSRWYRLGDALQDRLPPGVTHVKGDS
jgi:hypothetical protein